MTTVLGRKQTTDNELWKQVAEHIEDYVSREEVKQAGDDAAADIRARTVTKKAAYAWSGGKDSIVLGDLCRRAEVYDCVFAHTDLEYPEFLRWCMEHLPDRCSVIHVGMDLEWLDRHPKMLFPQSKELNQWYQMVQRRAFSQYFRDRDLDVLLVGHRKADGNVVGPENTIRKADGEVRYSPMADWPHELVLGYIHYYGLELPPIYGWKDGYRCGTHPWPSRMHMKSIEQGFQEVAEIDRDIIRLAAEYFPAARNFLL